MFINETRIEVVRGDITTIEADAIVNAANTSLLGGGGVDGAIHRRGGKQILEDCMKIRARQDGCKVGEAVITRAGNLPAKHVIHTVGPVWNGGNSNEPTLLANAYRNSLQLAIDHGLSSIAFPNISTGIYGYPKEEAAKIAFNEVSRFISNTKSITHLIFVCFDTENYIIYLKLAASAR